MAEGLTIRVLIVMNIWM